MHEAERLESTGTGACFGPSDRQLRVEAKSSRRRSWASLASEEEKEKVQRPGQDPKHVQPIALHPPGTRSDRGVRLGCRHVECRSCILCVAHRNSFVERGCQPWIEDRSQSRPCDACGTAVEHVFKLKRRSSVGKDLEAVQPKLLFCRECSRSVLSQSQPKSLREFRKHLSKSVGATY